MFCVNWHRRKRMFLSGVSLFLTFSPALKAQRIRYLSLPEIQDTLYRFSGSGLPGTDIADAIHWDQWIGEQDSQVRSRIDRGVEDSISNFILYGTSYTTLPRLEGSDRSLTSSGELSSEARARIHALTVALTSRPHNERLEFVRQYLSKKGVPRNQVEDFLGRNLTRFATEQRHYQDELERATTSSDPNAVLLTRGTLYQNRGLSIDTSLLPNYAVEDTLRRLAAKNVVGPASIRRIAVVGPGLDFTDKRDGFDFYPLQTIQPFASLEAVLRSGTGKPDYLELSTLDLNPAVNAHVGALADRARGGRAYVVQLPRDTSADWSADALSYWEHFGELLGARVEPLPVPHSLHGVTTRAVAIAPRFALHISPFDINIVTQTLDLPAAQHFDLIVATNVLVYYDHFQQCLALASIARLLSPGGIFISNTVLPAEHDPLLEFLGRRSVNYSSSGSYGDDIVVYRRRNSAPAE